MNSAETEGTFLPDGGWQPNPGSGFRPLTGQEVVDLQQISLLVNPIFGGEGNATWSQHHPIARDIFEAGGGVAWHNF